MATQLFHLTSTCSTVRHTHSPFMTPEASIYSFPRSDKEKENILQCESGWIDKGAYPFHSQSALDDPPVDISNHQRNYFLQTFKSGDLNLVHLGSDQILPAALSTQAHLHPLFSFNLFYDHWNTSVNFLIPWTLLSPSETVKMSPTLTVNSSPLHVYFTFTSHCAVPNIDITKGKFFFQLSWFLILGSLPPQDPQREQKSSVISTDWVTCNYSHRGKIFTYFVCFSFVHLFHACWDFVFKFLW